MEDRAAKVKIIHGFDPKIPLAGQGREKLVKVTPGFDPKIPLAGAPGSRESQVKVTHGKEPEPIADAEQR